MALINKITFKNVISFTMPTIIMMVFMSVYQMVDGVFISNIIGTNALSAVNIVFPVISFLIGVSIMLGTGGSAIIAKNLGEDKPDKARRQFTLIILTGIVVGIVTAAIGVIFIDPIVRILGATEAIYQYCIDYLFILCLAAPFAVLQMLFSCFFPAAGKPRLGLTVISIGGIANIILDYLFMAVLDMGIKGAALATSIGYALSKKSLLYFEKPELDFKMLLFTCANGSSEMVTNLANGVTTFLFNYMMMKFIGEDGVAAITVALYAQFLLSAVFMGYSNGIAPVISFNYGAQDIPSLKKLIKISLVFIFFNSILWFALSMILKLPIIGIFAEQGGTVWQITNSGWHLFALNFLIAGFNIFASSMFTAFSNGLVSALISFLRTFGFLAASILLLPIFIDIDGIWLSVTVAEAATLIVSVICFIRGKKRYKY